MSIDARLNSTPRVYSVSSETKFSNFDSLIAVDAGSDGFKIKDSLGISSHWPSGVPFPIAKKEGVVTEITIAAPASGTLNATVAVFY